LRRQLEEAERKVDDLTQALQAAQTHYAQSQQRHQDATRRLQHYAESLIAQQERAHFLRGAAQVQQTLLRFGERLKRHKLNQLEIQITQSFLYLLHKPDLIRRLEIDSESFGLRLYDGAGQAVPQGRLSAGEKQLLAIALLWGLARASGRRLPVAIDTPLGRLDSSHRRHLLERYFPQASHQVLLLSTDTEIGPQEAALLRESQAISREYLIRHQALGATIEPGYFG
jgi:DNA sulfur modification protein DndD